MKWLFLLCLGSPAMADDMRMAVTTSFHNSGLAEVLLPQIAEETGVDVQLLVVGTGQALRLGAAGDVDAVFVHSKAAEEAFVDAGFGTHRREIMFNDFVIVGPTEDPANVAGASNVTEAMDRIATAGAPFVSRGDDSGTHKKEQSLWSSPPQGNWYKDVGAGMGAALNTAAGLGAYTLSDRASWLNFSNREEMRLHFAGDPALFNQYAYLPVSVERHAHVQTDAADRVEAWLVSPAAQSAINGYAIAGEQVFTFNATP